MNYSSIETPIESRIKEKPDIFCPQYVSHYPLTKIYSLLIIFFFSFLIRMPLGWAGTAHLSWDPNPDSDLAGYTVYYGLSSKSYDQAIDVGLTNSYEAAGLLDGVTYYFALKAYDTGGNESAFSEEVPFISGDLPILIGPVAAILVSPSSATINTGTSQQFAAVAKDAQGLQVPDAILSWLSSNPAVAVMNSAGLATAISAGTTVITASNNGIVSNQASLQATAPAPPPSPTAPPPPTPVLAAIAVSPSSVTIEAGKTYQFAAIAKDSLGGQLGGIGFAWNSSNSAVAVMNSAGLATAISAGTTMITASSGGIMSNQAVLQAAAVPQQVTPPPSPPSLHIEVSPPSATLPVMDSIQFSAVAKDAQGGQVGGLNFIWNSSNPGVAQMDPNGTVTGFSIGTAKITASNEDLVSNQALLQVTPAPGEDTASEGPVVAAIEISPLSVIVSKNASQQFAAVAKDAQGSQISKPDLTWSSSHPDVAMIDSSGIATSLLPGTATINASSSTVFSNSVNLMVKRLQSSSEIRGGGCGIVRMRGGRPPDNRQIAINLLVLFAPLVVSSLAKWATRLRRMRREEWVEAFGVWNGLRVATVSLGIFMVAVMSQEAFTLFSAAI